MKSKIRIQGIHCQSCIMNIKDALQGIAEADIGLDGSAVLTHSTPLKEIINKIKKEGYGVR